jgi:hypothetical protein
MTKRTNRNILICSVVGLLLLTAVSFAWSRGIADVSNTIHNLSTSQNPMYMGVYRAHDVEEVCVFCHTPHGGLLTGPLWNHSMPSASSFTHYNSASLSGYLQGLSATRNVNDESLLCMACHDGSVAVNHLVNDPNSLNGAFIDMGLAAGTDVFIVDIFGAPASRIGASLDNLSGSGDLSDDHPISFSYDDVLADSAYNGGSKDGELNPVVTAVSDEVRFFGAKNRVECSSCHDPHVDYVTQQLDYAPFLITPNTGSALCLACHNK